MNLTTCAELPKSSWRSNWPTSDAENASDDTARKPMKSDTDAIDAKIIAMHANETANETAKETANETAITNASNETRIKRILETEDSFLTTVFQTAW